MNKKKDEALEEETKKTTSRMAIIVSVGAGIVFVSVVGVAIYFYLLYQGVASKNMENDTEKLVEAVGKLVDVPQGEIPSVATVADKTKLEGQAFFKKAENGDRVLMYTDSGKAILYRPSTKKVIDMTTINVNEGVASLENNPTKEPEGRSVEPVVESTQAETPTIVLINGTEKKGVTQRYEDEILASHPEVSVKDKVAAIKKDYEKTIIIDISGKFPDLVATLVKEYSAEKGVFPSEELKPESDIVILFGKDKIR